ncbi:SRPBCC family protein [Pseudonocardia saturnea]
MTTTLTAADGRSVLRMERRLGHPPARVWPALTEPAQLARWFPSGVEIDLRPGGALTFTQEGAPPASGVITDLDPPRVVAFTWDTDHLRFELLPDGDGSVLLLTHTFDDRVGAASFAAGWDTCIAALDDADPAVDHRVLHERYVEELGLLAPVVTGTAERWEVRVDRQLVHPADVVRAVLHGVPGRWELVDGTGHGARLRHVRTGTGEPAREQAVRELPAAVAALVERLPVAQDA